MMMHSRNVASNTLFRRRGGEASLSRRCRRGFHALLLPPSTKQPYQSYYHHRTSSLATTKFAAATPTTTASTGRRRKSDNASYDSNNNKPMELERVYRLLQLESFTEDEMRNIFARIRQQQQQQPPPQNVDDISDTNVITHTQMTNFILERIRQIEQQQKSSNNDNEETTTTTISTTMSAPKLDGDQLQRDNDKDDEDDNDKSIQAMRQQYAAAQATQLLQVFPHQEENSTTAPSNQTSSSAASPESTSSSLGLLSLDTFVSTLRTKATNIDVPGMWPITVSMLLVGSSVGILTPAMPFVVEELGLTPGQYGYVVSAFAVAKMAGNIPSAILVERHGRKPYLVYSLSIIAMGVAGMGMATQFEQLYVCRLLTGLGVAGLSTAATMSITDLSTPLNRASTMAPIMSAFAAGTAMGPALGGYLVDGVGLQSTFYMVGASYLGLTLVNAKLLRETKPQDIVFPWQKEDEKPIAAAAKK